jgi:hypothetical protein
MEEVRVVVLCTSHMTETDGRRLEQVSNEGLEDSAYQPCRGAFPEGGWFYAGGSPRDPWRHGWSRELRKVLAWAKGRGYDYVLFDRDAETIDDLPVFEW